MANRCGCNKRIPRGATHCMKCARTGMGYRSNIENELREAEAKRAADALKTEQAKAARKARDKQIAERRRQAKAKDQKAATPVKKTGKWW